MDTGFAEREAALRARLDAPAPTTWRPDDASTGHSKLLIGELVSVEAGHTDWGSKQIAIVRDAGGQLWNVWLLHKVLMDEFARQQPKLGEMLAISYEGKVMPASGGSAYEKYRLVIDRPTSDVDWGSVSSDERAAPEPAPTAEAEPAAVDECDACGFRAGKHAPGCPSDIPF